MEKNNTVVAVFEQHIQADSAIRKLADSDFPMKQLSVIGKGYHTEEKVIGFYNTGDRMQFWGKYGAFWGGMWGILAGGLFLTVPIVGPVVVLGSFAAMVFTGIEGAVVVGGLSALGAALFSIGIPKDSVVAYEEAIKADDFIVMAQGSAEEVDRARVILSANGARKVDGHCCKSGGDKSDVKPLKIAS